MPLFPERLREISVELASRPGHEKVRTLIYEILVHGLGARSTEVLFEKPVPEVHGRIDALLGRTVFEFKSDLRRERADAEEKLTRYLHEREAQARERFVGIATDGAEFIPYERRDDALCQLPGHTTSKGEPRDLLSWLSAAVAVAADLEPTPDVVRRELGRGSLAWHVAHQDLAGLWAEVGQRADVRLKRELWARLLERVYGSPVDDDDALFFQHTYLTIVAKTMAIHVLGIDMPEPADLLAGRSFQEAGIAGAVESDFFDWPLSANRGADLVRRIAVQAARFRLRDIRTDVLKGLYESLIDPEQRHDLGEYYTPDWLAARICAHVIDRPLEQRMLDPACGSGTFLFHAIRRLLAAADAAGTDNREALARCCRQIIGVDVHPVAAQIARVTYLLALGQERLRNRPRLAIPVYIGDSLQWNTSGFLAEREVRVEVPESGTILEFPIEVARGPERFDSVIGQMLSLSDRNAPDQALRSWLEREHGLGIHAVQTLVQTYNGLRDLHQGGRDHIWGFVARNLVRPVWLSQEVERADVVVGNPPWLSYRFMAHETQQRFREECQRRGIWAGGHLATQQDLSAYFFARCVELYLKPTGVLAFVMPYAAMTRRQFEGFRSGFFGSRSGRNGEVYAVVRFSEAWVFSDAVQPLFPVPSCVIFAKHLPEHAIRGALPDQVHYFSGTLPRRDSPPEETASALNSWQGPWPTTAEAGPGSPYRNAFRNGATIFPRMLCVVEHAPASPLGVNPDAPVVQSRRSKQEKPPWKDLPSLRGNMEARFLRSLFLGESIAPYRLLQPVLAVIPWDDAAGRLLDADAAQRTGYLHLARWLENAERLWREHGRGSVSFLGQLDYYGKLTAQLPVPPLRVLYSKAGTLPAAAVLEDTSAIIENTLYWMLAASAAEASYLVAILNSETVRSRVMARQARGQWGARHFDKVVLELPIPAFDHANPVHRQLAEVAEEAERVASLTALREGEYFVRARQRIRKALEDRGIAQRVDALVVDLLGTT